MNLSEFDYPLSEDKIAIVPTANRSDSKLLVWDQTILAEATYAAIASFIPSKYSLFFNNSKVIAARILFEKNATSTIEIFCLEPTASYLPVQLAMQATNRVEWNCLIGGAKKWKEGSLQKIFSYEGQEVILTAEKIKQGEGNYTILFSWNHPSIVFSEIISIIGNIPLPPYIQRAINTTDKDRYQTTFAKEEGSVAAPTAGLHFDENIFSTLKEKQIDVQFLTLHVGAGTFMPVKVEDMRAHSMHAEFIEINIATIEYLMQPGTKIVSVGTTSLRTLESLYWIGIKIKLYPNMLPNELSLLQWDAYELDGKDISQEASFTYLYNWMQLHAQTTLFTKTQLMIVPGYQFKVSRGLITNFHQPKSTLLLIIAAITGKEWKNIYQYALDHEYRFLSYGDGCLFWMHQG